MRGALAEPQRRLRQMTPIHTLTSHRGSASAASSSRPVNRVFTWAGANVSRKPRKSAKWSESQSG
jgi:hypothetical protein